VNRQVREPYAWWCERRTLAFSQSRLLDWQIVICYFFTQHQTPLEPYLSFPALSQAALLENDPK